MPVLNGLAFLEAYGQLPWAEPMPVVVLLSTSLHLLDLARAQQLPTAGVLTMPLTREKVLGLF